MGCDIHLYVEKKNKNGEWETADLFTRNKYYSKDNNEHEEKEYEVQHMFSNRDYALFALLADVRNYNNVEPIDSPRGVPGDSCDVISEAYKINEPDVHSASYFTLQELIDYDKEHKSIKRGGKVSPQCAENLLKGITPAEWCRDTSDLTWVYREWHDSDSPLSVIIDRLKYRADELYFIYDFLWESNRESGRQEAYEKSADIRIVFWFDN